MEPGITVKPRPMRSSSPPHSTTHPTLALTQTLGLHFLHPLPFFLFPAIKAGATGNAP